MHPDEENKANPEPKEILDGPTNEADTGDLLSVSEDEQLDVDPTDEGDHTALGDGGDDTDGMNEIEDGEVVGEDELQ